MDLLAKIDGTIPIERLSENTSQELWNAIKCSFPELPSEKLDFRLYSNWMEFDLCDRFPFNFEPNESSFGSKEEGIVLPR